jgi:hypothetical protein
MGALHMIIYTSTEGEVEEEKFVMSALDVRLRVHEDNESGTVWILLKTSGTMTKLFRLVSA